MAAIAAPLLEQAAVWGARALGLAIGAKGADALNDLAEKRKKESDDAKAAPMSQAQAVSTTTTAKKCDACPPDCGSFYIRSTSGWSPESIAYQARVGGFPVTPGSIAEWTFEGVQFDGFTSARCLLKEAKAKYDQFLKFDKKGEEIVAEYWGGEMALLKEAASQAAVAAPPTIKLNWFWMQPRSYVFWSTKIKRFAPKIFHIYMP